MRWTLCYALLTLTVMAAMNAAWDHLFHRGPIIPWGLAGFQAVAMPLVFAGFGASSELRSRRNRPRQVGGPGGEIQIRDRWDGEILATFYRADLRTGALAGANLENANLWGEHLAGADLCGVNLRESCLRDVNLNDANLARANLQYANVTGASLRNADLRGADLREACLSNADLTGAIYDRSTRWGPRTKTERRACILVDGDVGGLPLPAKPPNGDRDKLPRPTASRAELLCIGDAGESAPSTSNTAQSASATGAFNPIDPVHPVQTL
ncbi:MAG: pentapeptide repeat-containing protein [Actinomycetota bacterium]